MKPIIFSTEMVKAILGGRKTQTRRVIKNIPDTPTPIGKISVFDNYENDEWCWFSSGTSAIYTAVGKHIKCPYGKIGDRLWVRETFWADDKNWIIFKADGNNNPFSSKWKPSIYMPRDYARLFLEITDIRVERVQDISQEDCIKEGVEGGWAYPKPKDLNNTPCVKIDPILDFRLLWDSINKKRGYGWDKNPYVWVVEFKKVEG